MVSKPEWLHRHRNRQYHRLWELVERYGHDERRALQSMGHKSLVADRVRSLFQYVGDVEVGGCNVGNGTWSNPFTNDSFWWEKACAIPSGEATHATDDGWANSSFNLDSSGEYFRFRADVATSFANPTNSGRVIRETDFAAAVDACWWSGSSIPKWTGVVSAGSITLTSSNQVHDVLGWGSTAINFYRSAGRAPCSTVVNQQMQIECDDHGVFGTSTTWHGYQNQYMVAVIGVSPQNQIALERNSILHQKTWP